MTMTSIRIQITKDQAIEAISELVLQDRRFDAATWSAWDAERLEHAAAIIRQAIEEKEDVGQKALREARCSA